MKIFVFQGNPDNEDTLCADFASVYGREAVAAGHDVKRANIGDLQFDPILHKGYKVIQELEPDLKAVQEDMKWAEHIVVIYPNWWCTMPALLKGFFDRAWLPGFAFHFRKNGLGWDRMLSGRTARVIVLSKSRPWEIRLLFGDYTNEIARGILGFSGLKVRITKIGNSEALSPEKKASWERKIGALARRGK